MYAYRKLANIALAILFALGPVAHANDLGTIAVKHAMYTVDRCVATQNGTVALPEHIRPGVQQFKIEIDMDKVLVDVGAQNVAAALAEGYKIPYHWLIFEWVEDDDCLPFWNGYGPEGRGWLHVGGVAPEWQAKQDTLRALQERERELKPPPVAKPKPLGLLSDGAKIVSPKKPLSSLSDGAKILPPPP